MIEGALERVETDQIHGWAYSPEDRDDRLLVEVFVRGRLRASSWAQGPGGSAAPGEHGHGFVVGLLRPLADAELPQVEVYATARSGERARLGRAGEPRGAAPGVAGGGFRWPFPLARGGAPAAGELRLEIAAAIERLGICRFAGESWVGSRGAALPIRRVALRAVGPQPPTAIEIKGLLPGGRETAWIGGGEFCPPAEASGPLVGFAVRASEPQYEALYWGAFAAGGEIGPCRDGAACASPGGEEPLTALRIEIRERAAPR